MNTEYDGLQAYVIGFAMLFFQLAGISLALFFSDKLNGSFVKAFLVTFAINMCSMFVPFGTLGMVLGFQPSVISSLALALLISKKTIKT